MRLFYDLTAMPYLLVAIACGDRRSSVVVRGRLRRDQIEEVELAERLQLVAQIAEHEAHQLFGIGAITLRRAPLGLGHGLRVDDAL